jgi:Glycosyltransferase family 87
VIYFVLKLYRSTWAAIAFAIYLVLGSWGIAAGRFDLIPAALTLGAVILAARASWKWAYTLLALATMLKFYPVVLLAPFLIAQQMQFQGRWNSWRRLSGVGVFVGICVVLTVLSLVLNVADTLNPLRYFLARPIQVESLQATLLWLASLLGHPIQYVFTFQSLNFQSSLSSKVSLLFDACLVIGLLYTFWLQWRGKLDIYTASLMTLLVVMITGKVFSPQYLIWIVPLIAYVGQANWKWLVSWSLVGIVTTIIYPYLYVTFLIYNKQYYPIVLVRNTILLIIVLVLLYYAGRFGLLTETRPKQVVTESSTS